jgi:hypothetical protein
MSWIIDEYSYHFFKEDFLEYDEVPGSSLSRGLEYESDNPFREASPKALAYKNRAVVNP